MDHAILAHVDDCLARCAAYDDPAVWISRYCEAAVADLVAAALARRNAGIAQPLLGLTFAIKDNIDAAGLPTTAACPAFSYLPEASAFVVQKLIDAGAIPLGKTNLDQFATGLVGTRSPYGACKNVYNRNYISGGSSSGSAVAVAAGLVDFSLGTDTAGSGRVPAAFNNLVGLKPSKGRLSTSGLVPACRSLDCISIFTTHVDLARRVLAVAEGYDPADAYSRKRGEFPAPKFMGGQTRFRFGVPADDDLQFFGDGEASRLYRKALAHAVQRGGIPVTIDYTPFLETAKLLYEGPWLAERYAAVKSLLLKSPGSLLPGTAGLILTATRYSAVDAFEAQYRLQSLIRQAEAQLNRIDVLLLPTAPTIYTIAQIEAEPLRLNQNLGYYTNFVNLLDLCAIAIPSGFRADGLPSGVTLMAPAGADEALLDLAERFAESAESSHTFSKVQR